MRRRLIRFLLVPLLMIAAVAAVVMGIRYSSKVGSGAAAKDEKPHVYIQQGHSLAVPHAAWSPDGKYMLASDATGSIILWDANSGRELRNLEFGATSLGLAVAFLPDSRHFLLDGGDSTVQIWDLDTFTEVKCFRAAASIRSLTLSKQGDVLLCTTTSSTVHLWDLRSGRELQRLSTLPGGSWCSALSPDGRLAIIQGSTDSTLTLWNVTEGREVREFAIPLGEPVCAAFSSDGARIACGSGDRRTLDGVRLLGWRSNRYIKDMAAIDVWNVADGHSICHNEPQNYVVSSIQFEPNGQQLITTAVDSVISWWNLESCSLTTRLVNGRNLVLNVLFSQDRKQMIAAGDEYLRTWDIARKEIVREFAAPAMVDNHAGYSKDGSRVLVAPRWRDVGGPFSDRLYVWDMQTGRRETEENMQPQKLRHGFSDDCRYGFTIRIDRDLTPPLGYLEFWSLEKGPLGSTEHTLTRFPWSWDFTKDGDYAIANTDDSLYTLWETVSGRIVRRIICSDPPRVNWSGDLVGMSLSGDAKHAAAVRQPVGLLLDFDAGTCKLIRSSRDSTTGIADCRISDDGEMALFSWMDRSVDVWDVKNAKLIDSYKVDGFGDLDGFVHEMKISPDGKYFSGWMLQRTTNLVPNESGTLDTLSDWLTRAGGVWEVRTGRLKQETDYDPRGLFNSDGRYLLTCLDDKGTRIRNKENGKEILHLVSFWNGEWVAVTPEGYYTASVNGDQFLNVRTGTKITGIEPYRSTFYQPAVVEAALRLGDSELAISEVLGCKAACTTIADLPEMEPPSLSVTYPRDGDTLQTVDTLLAFHIEDHRNPIASVRVFVNGRAIRGGQGDRTEGMHLKIPRDQKTLDLKVPVRLDEGDNLITIAALGKSEALNALHVFVNPKEKAGARMEIDTVWILAVGVNRYQDRKLPSLNYCVNDAQGVVRSFEAQEGVVCRKVMSRIISDSDPLKPTAATIIDNLRFLHQGGPGDLTVLFLAGHGMKNERGDFYFLPADAKIIEPGVFEPSRAVAGSQLQWAMENSARRFVFVDACHSGDVGVDMVKLAREFKDNQVLILTSSEGNKPSEEADSLKHGVFSFATIQGMSGDADILGSDGKVSAMELIAYVSDKVSSLTRQRQNPVFWAPGGLSNFVVAVSDKSPTRAVSSLP